jgi:hypothetical protein
MSPTPPDSNTYDDDIIELTDIIEEDGAAATAADADDLDALLGAGADGTGDEDISFDDLLGDAEQGSDSDMADGGLDDLLESIEDENPGPIADESDDLDDLLGAADAGDSANDISSDTSGDSPDDLDDLLGDMPGDEGTDAAGDLDDLDDLLGETTDTDATPPAQDDIEAMLEENHGTSAADQGANDELDDLLGDMDDTNDFSETPDEAEDNTADSSNDFDDLDDLLGDATADSDAGQADDMSDLDDLLGDMDAADTPDEPASAPTPPPTSPDDTEDDALDLTDAMTVAEDATDIDDLDDLLGTDDSTPETTAPTAAAQDTPDEPDDLDALLGEDASASEPPEQENPDDLDDLLGDLDGTEGTAVQDDIVAEPQSEMPSDAQEDDLDQLLASESDAPHSRKDASDAPDVFDALNELDELEDLDDMGSAPSAPHDMPEPELAPAPEEVTNVKAAEEEMEAPSQPASQPAPEPAAEPKAGAEKEPEPGKSDASPLSDEEQFDAFLAGDTKEEPGDPLTDDEDLAAILGELEQGPAGQDEADALFESPRAESEPESTPEPLEAAAESNAPEDIDLTDELDALGAPDSTDTSDDLDDLEDLDGLGELDKTAQQDFPDTALNAPEDASLQDMDTEDDPADLPDAAHAQEAQGAQETLDTDLPGTSSENADETGPDPEVDALLQDMEDGSDTTESLDNDIDDDIQGMLEEMDESPDTTGEKMADAPELAGIMSDSSEDIDDFLQDIESLDHESGPEEKVHLDDSPLDNANLAETPASCAPYVPDAPKDQATSAEQVDHLSERISRLEEGITQFEALEARFATLLDGVESKLESLREHDADTGQGSAPLDEQALAERLADILEDTLTQRLDAMITGKVESAVAERIDAASVLLKNSLQEEIRTRIEDEVPLAAARIIREEIQALGEDFEE